MTAREAFSADSSVMPAPLISHQAPLIEETKDPAIDVVVPVAHFPDGQLSWSSGRKWLHVAIVAMVAFTTPLGSSIYTPALPQLTQSLGIEDRASLSHLTISAYILGFSTGPLLIGPLSAVHGKARLYQLCAVCYTVFSGLCAAAPSIWWLIVFRFLAGSAGACPMALGAATIADMFDKGMRGRALSFVAFGSVSAPVLGPVAGGIISQGALGWRGCFLLPMAVGCVNIILVFFVMSETAPRSVARRLNSVAEDGDEGRDPLLGRAPSHETSKLLRKAAMQTFRVLLHPAVSSIVLISSFFYSLQVWLYVDIPATYEDVYGFSPAEAGSLFMFIGTGTIVSLLASGMLSDRIMDACARRSKDGLRQAEHRLPLLIAGAGVVTCGMFVYGLGGRETVWWVVPAGGNVLTGAGLFAVSMSSALYLVDFSTKHAVSTASALALVRFGIGSLAPILVGQHRLLTDGEQVRLVAAGVAGGIMVGMLIWGTNGKSLREMAELAVLLKEDGFD